MFVASPANFELHSTSVKKRTQLVPRPRPLRSAARTDRPRLLPRNSDAFRSILDRPNRKNRAPWWVFFFFPPAQPPGTLATCSASRDRVPEPALCRPATLLSPGKSWSGERLVIAPARLAPRKFPSRLFAERRPVRRAGAAHRIRRSLFCMSQPRSPPRKRIECASRRPFRPGGAKRRAGLCFAVRFRSGGVWTRAQIRADRSAFGIGDLYLQGPRRFLYEENPFFCGIYRPIGRSSLVPSLRGRRLSSALPVMRALFAFAEPWVVAPTSPCLR